MGERRPRTSLSRYPALPTLKSSSRVVASRLRTARVGRRYPAASSSHSVVECRTCGDALPGGGGGDHDVVPARLERRSRCRDRDRDVERAPSMLVPYVDAYVDAGTSRAFHCSSGGGEGLLF